MAGSYPDVNVYIDFDNGALSATETWTDVTAYVVGRVRFSYGRDNAVDDFQPGTGSVTLDNRDGRFDPSNTSSPYYGKLKVRRRIKISASIPAVTSGTIARGWIDGWPQHYDFRDQCYVELTFRDFLAIASTLPMPDSVFDYQIDSYGTDLWAWYKNDDITAVAVDSSGNERHSRWNVWEGAGSPWGGLATSDGTITTGLVDSPVVSATSHVDPKDPKSPAGGGRKGKNVAAMLAEVGQPLGGATPVVRSVSMVIDNEQWRSSELLQTNFSFEIWVKARQAFPLAVTSLASSTTPISQPLIHWGYTGGASWQFFLNSSGKPSVLVQDPAGAQAGYTPPTIPSLLDGLPHQLVWSFVKATSVFNFYVDGVQYSPSVTLAGWPAPTLHPAVIGYNDSGPAILQSTIGDVIFYNKTLSSTEVRENWYAGRYGSLNIIVSQQTTDTIVAQALLMAGASNVTFENNITGNGHNVNAGDVQGQNLGDYLRKIAASEQGLLFYRPDGTLVFHGADWPVALAKAKTVQQSYGDDAGALFGYSEVKYRSGADHLANDVTVNYVGGTQRFRDTASIADYGPVTVNIDTYLASAAEALQVGAFRVAQWGAPQAETVVPEVIEFQPNTDAEWDAVFRMEPGFRLNLLHTRPNGTTQEGDYFVQSISHEFDAADGGEWRVLASVAPADNPGRPFTWGESVWGGPDVFWL